MRIVPTLILTSLMACTPFDVRERATTPGPHAVGHRQSTVTYTAADGSERTLPVELWYPAVEGGDEPPAVYGVASVVEITDEDVRAEATPIDDDAPVLVYSHGSGGVGALAYPYGRHLASHGWVVVAPDHIGNTSDDLFAGAGAIVQAAVDRPEDVRAVLDALEAGQLDGEVAAIADVQRTAVLGHSFGGYTTYRSPGIGITLDVFDCADPLLPGCDILQEEGSVESLTRPTPDPRVKALLPQAPAFAAAFEADLLAGAPPALLMSGGRDITTPDTTQAGVFWDATDHPDDHWLQVPDGAHYSFISVCDDVPDTLLGLLGADADGCGPSFTPTVDLLPILSAYTLAFAEWHVNDDDRYAPLFDLEEDALAETVVLSGR